MRLISHEKGVSTSRHEIQRHRAAMNSSDSSRASAELRTRVGAIGLIPPAVGAFMRRMEVTEEQLETRTHFGTLGPVPPEVDAFRRRMGITDRQWETTRSKKQTSAAQWKTIGILRGKKAIRNGMIEHRDNMIQRKDRIIQQKNDSVESMSARLAAAEAALGEEKQEATYLGNIGYGAFYLVESMFRGIETVLGFWRPRVGTLTGPHWLRAWIWGVEAVESTAMKEVRTTLM